MFRALNFSVGRWSVFARLLSLARLLKWFGLVGIIILVIRESGVRRVLVILPSVASTKFKIACTFIEIAIGKERLNTLFSCKKEWIRFAIDIRLIWVAIIACKQAFGEGVGLPAVHKPRCHSKRSQSGNDIYTRCTVCPDGQMKFNLVYIVLFVSKTTLVL